MIRSIYKRLIICIMLLAVVFSATFTVSQAEEGEVLSDNAYLSNLSISQGSLRPSFGRTNFQYHVTVNEDVEQLSIDVTTEDSGAKFGISSTKLKKGEVTTITVTVEAADHKTVKFYNLDVTRSGTSDKNSGTSSKETESSEPEKDSPQSVSAVFSNVPASSKKPESKEEPPSSKEASSSKKEVSSSKKEAEKSEAPSSKEEPQSEPEVILNPPKDNEKKDLASRLDEEDSNKTSAAAAGIKDEDLNNRSGRSGSVLVDIIVFVCGLGFGVGVGMAYFAYRKKKGKSDLISKN